MHFLKFEDIEGNECLINANHIVNFKRLESGDSRGITRVELVNGKYIEINEPLKQVESVLRREKLI